MTGPNSKPMRKPTIEAAKFLATVARRFVNDRANANEVEAAIKVWHTACAENCRFCGATLTGKPELHRCVRVPDGFVLTDASGPYVLRPDGSQDYSQETVERALAYLKKQEGNR
jgi:hypothetical protein